MNTSEKTDMIAAALYAVQRDLPNPRKNAKADAGKFTYRYLDLPALIAHCHKALSDAGVSVIQEVKGGPGFVEVHTILMHLAGQYIELGPLFMPAQGDAQQFGSATTYARRYALAAALNLAADEDDDATSARASTSTLPARRTGRGGSDSLPTDAAPSATTSADGKPADAGSESESFGEGLNGSEPATRLATNEQWRNLLQTTDGSMVKAVNKINRANATNYTKATAQEGATWDELVKAMT